ncbi:MAG: hypothetical protein ACOCVF_00480 [bacterium]
MNQNINIPLMGQVYYIDSLVKHDKVSYVDYIQKPDNPQFNLPTLIVGWEYLQSFNFEVNILEKKINDSLFWEFSFNEHKSNHVNGVNDFVNGVPFLYFNSQFKFKNIDPIFNKINNTNDLDKYFNLIDKAYVYNNENLYLQTNNVVLSFNLLMFRYFKINIDSYIQNINKNIIYFDDGTIFTELCKKYNFMYEFKRYVVTLL